MDWYCYGLPVLTHWIVNLFHSRVPTTLTIALWYIPLVKYWQLKEFVAALGLLTVLMDQIQEAATHFVCCSTSVEDLDLYPLSVDPIVPIHGLCKSQDKTDLVCCSRPLWVENCGLLGIHVCLIHRLYVINSYYWDCYYGNHTSANHCDDPDQWDILRTTHAAKFNASIKLCYTVVHRALVKSDS